MAEQSAFTMNISLPMPLKQYVDGKVATGFYGSASEFVREAIREKLLREQERERAEALLASKLIEGLDSGTGIPHTASYAQTKKKALRERMSGDQKDQ